MTASWVANKPAYVAYVDGKIVHTKAPKQRKPVEEYLKAQGRFKHLFKPKRNDELIGKIQDIVDRYWESIPGQT